MAKANRVDGGRLVISVDLEWDIRRHHVADERRLDAVAADLFKQFADHRVPATWAVADPVHSAATEAVLGGDVEHEIGVLGDPSWVGPGTDRRRFARELSRRFEGARAVGMSVSSLLLRDVELVDHLDLLVKHRVSIVRQGLNRNRNQARSAHPQPLRFGLWQACESLRLPGTSRWRLGGGSYSACRGIGRAIASRQTTHLAIDAPRLADLGNSGLQLVERVLQYAEKRQRQGDLEIVPLGQLVESISPTRQSQPSRSVLRPAA